MQPRVPQKKSPLEVAICRSVIFLSLTFVNKVVSRLTYKSKLLIPKALW